MMVLHGVVTGHVKREGDKINEATGEVRHWVMNIFSVFDGQHVWEAQLADDFGDLAVGEVVTATVALSTFRNDVQVRLVSRCDGPAVVSAFTPELAALLLSTGLGQVVALQGDPAKRAA